MNMMVAAIGIALTSMVLAAPASAADVGGKAVEYKVGEQVFEGFLAAPQTDAKAPGVLLVPDWLGNDDYTRQKATQLAGMGYTTFVVDMYGKGVRPTGPQEAGALAGKIKTDRAVMRQRVNASLAVLRASAQVDPKRIVAIGYCFGGTTVLELARSGAEVAGVVTFHGGLDTPHPEDARNIRCKVLVLHGADDPFVPAKDVAAFEDEMRQAKVDWQMNLYSNAVHSFTRPSAGNDPSKGAAYSESADRRSWEAMKAFFAELFAGK
ncbi:MAG: dienelactone hydrolase family protein [Tepidisphaeraceae bacterium]|jgi:dienelactone hydrolase